MSKVRIASKADLAEPGCKVYQVNGHTLALFKTEQGLFAVDNRCPHMGFPLDKGSVKDGILSLHTILAKPLSLAYTSNVCRILNPV